MSDNYRFYTTKMAELHRHRMRARPLHNELDELLRFVLRCEAAWDERASPSRPQQDE
ncbi:MAG TPA: hypothetical protein VGK42_13690 [Candidatus Dormibacteraeota bacterium]|jgi:hypothetical protein